MALEKTLESDGRQRTDDSHTGSLNDGFPRKTVKSALELLESLKPKIISILTDNTKIEADPQKRSLEVILDHLDVFPPGSTTNSRVLFLGPSEQANLNGEWDRLWTVSGTRRGSRTHLLSPVAKAAFFYLSD